MGLFIVREGEGEEAAIQSLVVRLSDHHGLGLPYPDKRGNWKKPLLTEAHVREACEQVRGYGSCDALLLTRDADNKDRPEADCPKFSAPEIAEWVRALALPFPVAVVLFYKEYETLFLAGAGGMAGKPVTDQRGRTIEIIEADVAAHPAPEHPRDAKGWVRDNLVEGYKPTLFQASLTRLLQFEVMQDSALSSYRRLVSALHYLSANFGVAGAVYPPSVEVVAHA